MKKSIYIYWIIINSLTVSFFSCQSNPIEKVQGVFNVDKVELKGLLKQKLDNESLFAAALLDKAIENAIVEFKINGDSIRGFIFLVGQTTIINSIITIENDSLVIRTDNLNAHLIPNEKGLFFVNKNTKIGFQLLKSDKNELSEDTKNAISMLSQKVKAQNEFNTNLGKWQKGNFVDEFGDKTGDDYPFSIVHGEHENSAIIKSDVYVKTTIDGESLYFQVFNSSMTMKENFPDKEFGSVKIKFPSGEVKEEDFFFSNSRALESPANKNYLVRSHLMSDSGELKILIDLSTVNRFYSDKYQFSISRGNLPEILSQLKKN
ncbi:MAG TPA: hypothetical protein DCF33_20960 [Saprospirales bacterium]|nr:hypothetical protein [Saprospirales bacterium]